MHWWFGACLVGCGCNNRFGSQALSYRRCWEPPPPSLPHCVSLRGRRPIPLTEDYDTAMKKLIFLLLLGAVGFVAYKYFTEEGY